MAGLGSPFLGMGGAAGAWRGTLCKGGGCLIPAMLPPDSHCPWGGCTTLVPRHPAQGRRCVSPDRARLYTLMPWALLLMLSLQNTAGLRV